LPWHTNMGTFVPSLLHDVVIRVVRYLEWRSVEQLGFQGGHCCMQAPPRSFSSKEKHHTACGFTTQEDTHEKGRLIEDGPEKETLAL
jgi:hypothetical protein